MVSCQEDGPDSTSGRWMGEGFRVSCQDDGPDPTSGRRMGGQDDGLR
jgi:hypothetical protein